MSTHVSATGAHSSRVAQMISMLGLFFRDWLTSVPSILLALTIVFVSVIANRLIVWKIHPAYIVAFAILSAYAFALPATRHYLSPAILRTLLVSLLAPPIIIALVDYTLLHEYDRRMVVLYVVAGIAENILGHAVCRRAFDPPPNDSQ